jgi:vacuolar-type H+-ATPase subunit I/STV1
LLIGLILDYYSVFNQLYFGLYIFSIFASVLSYAESLKNKDVKLILVNLVIFVLNMVMAVLSGWKEQVIVLLIILGAFSYPYYKKTVTIITPFLIFIAFYILPSYTEVYRNLNWYGSADKIEAAQIALDEFSNSSNLSEKNWEFLTYRLSEIGMFSIYVRNVPDRIDFYGFKILDQSLINLVPRILWKDKPITEEMVMQRVYENGITSEGVNVSAKPMYIVDAYLTSGIFGIFFFSLLLGSICSIVSVWAENLFGSYLIGSALVYNSLFNTLWRSNCFEFLFASVLIGIIIMIVLFFLGRVSGLILRNE